MATEIIIIIAVLLILAAVVAWVTRGKKTSPKENQSGVVNNGSSDLWSLESIATGNMVGINGETCEIKNIALVCKRKPMFGYSFDVSFDFEFVGGQQSITESGKLNPEDQFKLNGVYYYGIILAGGPNAKITKIRNLMVK